MGVVKKKRAAEIEPIIEPWCLPHDWSWQRIEQVAPVNPRRDHGRLNDDDEVVFVGMTSVGAGTGSIDVSTKRAARSVKQGFTRFETGDVLFAKITPCMENGKSAIVPDVAHGIAFGSTEFHVLSPQAVEPKYLYYWLSQRSFRELAEFNMTGTAGQKRVPTDFLRDALIPVPPRSVQKEIVTRVRELFTDLDDGETALARARSDLGTWRKALLKAAVTGELTADWRAANPPTETGADLLARILADRRARWAAEPRNKGKRYVEPSGIKQDELPALLALWTWSSLGQLLDGIEAGLNVKCVERVPAPAETGLVKISAVTWWDFNERASKTLSENHEHPEAWLIKDGDLLVSRANTLELVGAPAIVKGLTKRLMLSDKVLRLRMPEALRSWVFYVMRSPSGRSWIEDHSTGAQLSTRNISQDSLRRLPIPLPSSAELAQLYEVIESQIEGERILRSEADDASVASTTLRQSILAAAFRGELVT